MLPETVRDDSVSIMKQSKAGLQEGKHIKYIYFDTTKY